MCKPTQANDILHDALQHYPASGRLLHLAFKLALDNKKLDEANRIIERLGLAQPDYAETDLLRAQLCSKQRMFNEALELVNRLPKEHPQLLAKCLFLMARIQLKTKNF